MQRARHASRAWSRYRAHTIVSFFSFRLLASHYKHHKFLRYAISVFSSTHIQHSEHVTRHARGHAIAYAIIGSSVRSYDFAFTISDQYLAITDGLDMLHEEYVSETSQVM